MTTGDPAGEQLELVAAPARRGRGGHGSVAEELPVARVVIDTPLAHLDRPFDYAVPVELADTARPGVRVRVRFAGQDHDGFVLDRRAEADHPGELNLLRRVVSEEVVLTPHLAGIARQVADHYAGTLSDVLRLAIPPRHARAEGRVGARPDLEDIRAARRAAARGPGPEVTAQVWAPYPAGPALLRRLAAGEGPTAAWAALPCARTGGDWPDAVAAACAATLASGRGSVVVVPDHRDVDRVLTAVDRVLGPGQGLRLTADLGPGDRYTTWLSALRGRVPIVVGTRAAAYAPVSDPGLFVVWDDGDDSLREQRTPYPHVREILRLRAQESGAGLLVGGFTRTAETQHAVSAGGLREILPDPAALRRSVPRVQVAGEGHEAERDAAAAAARIPSLAWRAVRSALSRGPVLVQVPRRGYAVGLSCARCRHPVHCARCGGPSAIEQAGAPARCRWCGQEVPDQPCTECGGTGRRSAVVGEQRTAEEIGRAFPGVPVRTSRAGHVLASVTDEPAIVVATPGAEPVADAGYTATLLLDGWALLDRPGLDTEIETLRRWAAAAALTTPGAGGGQVVLVGVPPHGAVRPVEALVRWDPVWLVARELADRTALGLPPARRAAALTGDGTLLAPPGHDTPVDAGPRSTLGGVRVDLSGVQILGPVLAPPRTVTGGGSTEQCRLVVRDTLATSGDVVRVVRDLRAARSARRAPGHLQVVLDPPDVAV